MYNDVCGLNKMKSKIILIFLPLMIVMFSFGVSVGLYKHFPFNVLYFLKNFEKFSPTTVQNPTSFLNRYFIPNENITSPLDIKLTRDSGVFLTYGQSNSTNSGEYGYKVKNNVYHHIMGNTYPYDDPTIGTTGNGGSVWGMVGDKLIESGTYDKIIFSNCGFGGRSIRELKKLKYLGFLIINYEWLIKKYGKVDGILFHQGEGDNSDLGLETYYTNFLEMLKVLKDFNIEIPIYLSRTSYCTSKRPINTKLTDIQNKLIDDYELIRKGPNTDNIIGENYRIDDCHFSLEGYELFSDMWLEILIKKTSTSSQS